MCGVVVIGAGHAGVETAAALRGHGYAGPLTIVGGEAHLPYERPPLSKGQLEDEADAAGTPLRPEQFFVDSDVALLRGPAVEIDRLRQIVYVEGDRWIGYDHLVLATGSRPRRLDLPGVALRGVTALRTLDDALVLRRQLATARRIVVLGAGFIGMEIASAAVKRGVEVTVLEVNERVLSRSVTTPVSTAVAAYHRARGVQLCLGERAARVVGREGRATGVLTEWGRLLPADLVVLGVGAVPEDDLARRAGLAVDGGVVVDRSLTTSDPLISAIGDCAVVGDPLTGARRRLESIQNAIDQGRYVAARILGELRPYRAVPWFWSNQGSLKLQMVSLAREYDDLVVTGDGDRFSVLCLLNGRLAAVESVNDPGTHMAARRLLAGSVPTETELMAVDYDLRALARRTTAAA